MPFKRINDPKLWQERAEEARALAAMIVDAEAKENMFRVAGAYEEMAKRAEQRALTQP